MEFEFFSFVAVLVVLSTCFFIIKIELDALARGVDQLKETVDRSVKSAKDRQSNYTKDYMSNYMKTLEAVYPPVDLKKPVTKKAKSGKTKSKKGKSNG